MKFLSKFSLLFFWTLLIFILIDTPIYLTEYSGVYLADKILHFFLFGILAFLITFASLSFKNIKLKNVVLFSFGASLFYNLFCESLQKFIPGRSASVADFLTGALGILLFLILTYFFYRQKKEKLLLHICCAGCGAYVSRLLNENFNVTLFYYNPNIYPEDEYKRRIIEVERIAKKYKLNLIRGEYDHNAWLRKIKGLEEEPEKGKRCLLCYEDRLETTVKVARQKGFKYFTSTLSVSPHKVATAISAIGQELSKKYNIEFLDKDFKKNDGFKKSIELSRELEIYRQNYCGCEFSRKP